MEYIDKLTYRLFFFGGNFSAGEKTGTTANSQVNENILEDVTDWIALEIKEVLLDRWVRKIIQYNIGEVEDYGAFVNPINRDANMLATLANAMSTLANMGIISVEDFDKIREMFGFEKLNDDSEVIEEKDKDNDKDN